MCIVFTCGEHTFRREVEGYEGLVCRCYNCGNYSGSVVKSNPWFTFCFIVSRVFNSDTSPFGFVACVSAAADGRWPSGCFTTRSANPIALLDSL